MLELCLCPQTPVERMVDAACLSDMGRAILIVPEQLSHETERALAAHGADSCLKGEVLSFSRLAQRVASLYGGAARRRLDGAGRLLAMHRTVKELRSRLKYFASALTRSDFLQELLQTVDELKACCIQPEQLLRASEQMEGAQAQKLQELGLLLETYSAVCAGGAYDPKDMLDQLAQTLLEEDYADRRRFYAAGFLDFTAQELAILEALLRRGAELQVYLACDDLSESSEATEASQRTARQLRAMALRLGTTCRIRREEANFFPAQAFLLRHLYDGAEGVFPEQTQALRLLLAPDPESECRQAADAIWNLLRKGERCRQIGVALCAAESQLPLLRRELTSLQIPFYCTGRTPGSSRPLFALILSALQCVSYGFRREHVIECLRTGLFGLSQDETDILENYAIAWTIRGNRWSSPFTLHPDGYDAQMDEDATARLEKLNSLRERVIAPLLELQEKLKRAAKLSDQVLALYDFLEALSLTQRLEEMTDRLVQEGRNQLAAEEAQLYGALVGLLEQLHAQGDTAAIPVEEFFRLVQLLLRQYHVATIPQVLDSVTVGSLEDLRGRPFDDLFILGACDGVFPAYQKQQSLLGEEERTALRAFGLVLPGVEERLDRGSGAVYSVLSGAKQRLYLSANTTSQPSYLFSRICGQFPDCVRNPQEQLVSGLRSACAVAAQGGELPPLPEELAAQVREAAELLCAQRDYAPSALDPEAVRALYGVVLSLSPSRLDQLSKCRMAYYLQYGLRLQERRSFRFDAPVFGTFVHAVLEDTVRQVEELGGFQAVEDETIHALAQESIDEFVHSQLGDMEGRDERFRYLFYRNQQEILEILDSLSEEMRRSDFHAKAFELRFAPGGPLPPIPVEGASQRAQIVGVVDRADLAQVDGKEYLRIVDYKTGKKELDYTDLSMGEGLQMLIYLFALQKLGLPGTEAELQRAGVLYFPARERILNAPHRLSPEEAALRRRKESKRSGLITDDTQLLQAMEHCQEDPEFLPYKLTKSGRKGDLATQEQWDLLEKHVDRVLREKVEELSTGSTEANPYSRGARNSCTWCRFGPVCRFADSGKEMRSYQKTKAEDFWRDLGEEAQDGRL